MPERAAIAFMVRRVDSEMSGPRPPAAAAPLPDIGLGFLGIAVNRVRV